MTIDLIQKPASVGPQSIRFSLVTLLKVTVVVAFLCSRLPPPFLVILPLAYCVVRQFWCTVGETHRTDVVHNADLRTRDRPFWFSLATLLTLTAAIVFGCESLPLVLESLWYVLRQLPAMLACFSAFVLCIVAVNPGVFRKYATRNVTQFKRQNEAMDGLPPRIQFSLFALLKTMAVVAVVCTLVPVEAFRAVAFLVVEFSFVCVAGLCLCLLGLWLSHLPYQR